MNIYKYEALKRAFAELSQETEDHIINNKNTKKEYFTRFPNEYIQGNIKTKTPGLMLERYIRN